MSSTRRKTCSSNKRKVAVENEHINKKNDTAPSMEDNNEIEPETLHDCTTGNKTTRREKEQVSNNCTNLSTIELYN